jgi:hypothetical protein
MGDAPQLIYLIDWSKQHSLIRGQSGAAASHTDDVLVSENEERYRGSVAAHGQGHEEHMFFAVRPESQGEKDPSKTIY